MTIRPALKHLLLNASPASSSDAGEPDTRPDEERFPGLGAEPSDELANVSFEEEEESAEESERLLAEHLEELAKLSEDASTWDDHDDEDVGDDRSDARTRAIPAVLAALAEEPAELGPLADESSSPGQGDAGEGPGPSYLVVTSAFRSAADNDLLRHAAGARMTRRHLFIDAGAGPSPEALVDAGGAPSLPGGADVGKPSPESPAPTLDPMDEGEAWGFHVNLGRGESLTSTDPGIVFDAARRSATGKVRLSVRLDQPGQDPSVVYFPVLDVVDGELRVVKVRREKWRLQAAALAAEIDRLLAEYHADTKG